MTDPVQFLIAAAFYHPAAPYLAAILSLGPFSMAVIALDTKGRGPELRYPPRNRGQPADTAPSAALSDPSDCLAEAAIDCVPLLDTARAALLERLEDVVECLGRAQRVLPDVMLSRVLSLRADPDGTGIHEIAERALNRTGLDFGVFSYHGHLEIALMIGPPADADAGRAPPVVEIALKQAGVPLIRIPLDAPPAMLKARIKAALLPVSDRSWAAVPGRPDFA